MQAWKHVNERPLADVAEMLDVHEHDHVHVRQQQEIADSATNADAVAAKRHVDAARALALQVV